MHVCCNVHALDQLKECALSLDNITSFFFYMYTGVNLSLVTQSCMVATICTVPLEEGLLVWELQGYSFHGSLSAQHALD